MKISRSKVACKLFAVTTICLWVVLSASPQVQTTTTSTTGQPTKEVTVDRGEVLLVEGNDLVVKMEDGSIRHFPNIPESARITVEGKELGIHDLKPGMKLERTITTTSTPRTITTVKTVKGKIWNVNPPTSVTLTLDDGTHQTFKIPNGQKFNVDGRMVDAFHLRKGMIISATKVVEVPETEVSQERKVTGTMPPPPPAADQPILISEAQPSTPEKAPEQQAAPTELPHTASPLPLIGLLGVLLCGSSFAVRMLHRLRLR